MVNLFQGEANTTNLGEVIMSELSEVLEQVGQVCTLDGSIETVDSGRWQHGAACLDQEESGRSQRSRSDDYDYNKPLDRLIIR